MTFKRGFGWGAALVAVLALVVSLQAQNLGGIPAAIGAAVDYDTAFKVGGALRPNGTSGQGISVENTLTAQQASQELSLLNVAGTLAEYVSGAAPSYFTAARFATLTVTAGAATDPTIATNVYIEAAPTGGSSNYGLYALGLAHFAGGYSAPVTAAGGTETLTVADCGQTTLMDTITGSVITLPAATGSGCEFHFLVTVTNTSNDHSVVVVGNDEFVGGLTSIGTTADQSDAFTAADAGDVDAIQMNGSTEGGLLGTIITVKDISADNWGLSGSVISTDASATMLVTGVVAP